MTIGFVMTLTQCNISNAKVTVQTHPKSVSEPLLLTTILDLNNISHNCCASPRGTGQVLMNPTIEVGKEVPRHSQYGLMLGVPSTYVQVKDRPVEYGPTT